MKIIKYLTQRKIPRGRSKTNHQLKFQHQQIFKKIKSTNFNGQTPHQLTKRCQHNSEESIKISKDYLNIHQKINFQNTTER
jgi:hypothetical protein